MRASLPRRIFWPLGLAAVPLLLGGWIGFPDVHPLELDRRARAVFGEYFVRTESQENLERIIASVEGQGLPTLLAYRKPILVTPRGRWYKVVVPPNEDAERIVQRLMVNESISAIEPNYIYTVIRSAFDSPEPAPPQSSDPDYAVAPSLPDTPIADPLLERLYGLKKISAPAAWTRSVGSKRVVVANIDTGIDYNHPDLIQNLWSNPKEVCGDGLDNDQNGFIDDCIGWDFYGKDSRPYDDSEHGTHTAGTIAATGFNGVGVSGVAPSASLMNLKFLGGPAGSGTLEDAIGSIKYAIDNGAHIMSNSWSGGGFSQALFDVIQEAESKGVLFIAAAGNSATSNDVRPTFPASYRLGNVISVAATDHMDRLARFSCYGKMTVHVAAPGQNIFSTIPNGGYGSLSGTSMAAPHVTGVAVLLKSSFPELDSVALKDIILRSVDSIDSLSTRIQTGGRINAEKALRMAEEYQGKW
jgi:subtilisin family serine protease